MNLNEPFIAELQVEARSTRRMLERLPQESLPWRPHPKSRTLGELATHIVHLPGMFITQLDRDEMNRGDYEKAPTRTPEELVAVFDRNVAEATAMLKTLTDERLLAPWRYRDGEQLIFELPRYVVARTTALNHLIHHRGQLSVYLRLLDVPLPSIYGPSADEGTF